MGDAWGQQRVSLDFLALGRGLGLSTGQVERLWLRLTDDPRYFLAPDPERWLRTALAREATALSNVGRAPDENGAPALGRRSQQAVGIGKRTLAESIPVGDAPSASELPFRGELEQIFGTSLRDVRAYTHQEALLSPHGARAAAFRGGIAFAGMPTKELVAHEVVHIRQLQTAGVTRDATAAEAQAERAARAVARGTRRIEMSYVPTAAVSFDKGSDPSPGANLTDAKPGKTQPHWDFVREHLPTILDAIGQRLTRLPQPHPRLRWIGDGGKIVLARIKARAELKPEHAMFQLAQLVAPTDLWAIVDEARRGPAGTKREVLRLKVGTAFEQVVVSALPRMGMRAVVQWDRARGAPDADELVASSPLDLLLGGVLVDKAAVMWTPRKSGSPQDTEANAFKSGTRHVAFEYVGEKDATLWNWIKVTAPADATAEDVAATPLGRNVKALGSDQAYRFAVSPPYFGVPMEAARHIDEFTRHMTVEMLAKIRNEAAQDSRPIVDLADGRALRDSKVADEAALAQAPQPSKQLEPVHALRRVRLQADDIAQQIAPYKYRGVVTPALRFIERREKETADAKKLAMWGGALEAQERILHDVASELRDVVAAIAKQKVKPEDVSRNTPVRDLLIGYARAAGRSHLHAEAPAALAEARRLRGQLALSQAEHQIRSAREAGLAVDEAIASQRASDGTREPHADQSAMALQTLTWSDQQIRGKLARGEKVTDEEVQDLQLDASEVELRARLAALSTNLRDMKREAESLGLTGRQYGIYSVAAACDVMLRKINGSTEAQRPEDKNDTAKGGWHARLDAADNITVASQRRQARRNAIRDVNADLAAFRTQVDLTDFFKRAYDEIHNERMRKLINNIMLQVGLAVLTGEAIGALGVAIRGIAIAGEVGAEIRNASLAWEAASVVGQAAANTIVNGAMGGPMDARTFAENGLAIVLTSAAMKPFRGLLEETSGVERQIVSWGRTATKGGRLAAELVIETGVGIGTAGVAHAVTHGGHVGTQDAESWVTMGLSIAATKYVGRRTQGMKERLASAIHELGPRTASQFEALAKRADDLHNVAGKLGNRDPKAGKPPTSEEALSLLRKHHALVRDEHKLYVREHPNDKRRKANDADAASDAELLDASLQLSHLSPVVDGHIYEGTAQQIQEAFKAADDIGVSAWREWIPDRGVWRVKSGRRMIEIHETLAAGNKPKPHQSRHAAEEVPGSGFKGQNPGAPPVTIEQVQTAADEAMAILNYDTRKVGQRFARSGGKIYITETNGSRQMVVSLRVGEPSTGPARHNYVDGANEVIVTVSREARPQDLRRALAHELAELHAIVDNPARNRDGALHEHARPTSQDQLAAHDVGRVAELRVLLYELVHAPARKSEVQHEITKLIEHLGFDLKTFGSDPRARRIFGEDVMSLAYDAKLVQKNRMPIELSVDKHVRDNGDQIGPYTKEWLMHIEVPTGLNEPHLLVYAYAQLQNGKPIEGPEFGIENRSTVADIEWRVTMHKGGKSIKLTEFALDEASRRFERRFGHAPQTLSGDLAFENKTIFQKAYIAEIDKMQMQRQRVDKKAAAEAALKQTPFYAARATRNYDVTLDAIKSWEQMPYGNPPALRDVPKDIHVIAVKKGTL